MKKEVEKIVYTRDEEEKAAQELREMLLKSHREREAAASKLEAKHKAMLAPIKTHKTKREKSKKKSKKNSSGLFLENKGLVDY